MLEVGADLGLAYDGDADRVGVIDERGRRHEADLILVLLARDLLARHPGAKIVFDVKSSQALVDDIVGTAACPSCGKLGTRISSARCGKTGILLGGEVSGHMFFARGLLRGGRRDPRLRQDHGDRRAAPPGPISALFDSVPHRWLRRS